MTRPLSSLWRRAWHGAARGALGLLPTRWRHRLFRRLVRCDPAPGPQLELKIADTQDELEACFRILHDAYVASGFMKPDPSGLRVTIYHALPTTTTLCAKVDGRVVGTLSIIREGVFGFPLQSVFDLSDVRARRGQLAEISALAINPSFRKTGGQILFPLMKFMYAYCREYFDTRHILIAVNPNKIAMYESLLFFERLQAQVVDNYDFANGAPAVGATLDLKLAPERFRATYADQPEARDLYAYFVENRMPNIRWPARRFFTTNDPVMTPALLDYFFNQRTQVFAGMDDRKRWLLRSIYDDAAYARVLPQPSTEARASVALRQHHRFSIRCPAELRIESYGSWLVVPMTVVELSLGGFQAECQVPLPEGTCGHIQIALGELDIARLEVVAVHRHAVGSGVFYGFKVQASDGAWRHCVAALQAGLTHSDLVRHMPDTAPATPATPAVAASAVPGLARDLLEA